MRILRELSERIRRRVMSTVLEWRVSLEPTAIENRKKHDLPMPLVVSLTSYPARFHKLPLTLKCLLSQSVAPDKVILWIAHADKRLLTEPILAYRDLGVDICYCNDLHSYKKIIPTLEVYGECFIATADDDMYYWRTWLQELVSTYKEGNRHWVVCHRAHRIRVGPAGTPLSYMEWELETERQDISPLTFPTSGAGVLYPPHTFYSDVTICERFMELCPSGDDIWLYWMMRLNGRVARRTANRRRFYNWNDTDQAALWRKNLIDGANDVQLDRMLETYGFSG